MVPCHVISVFRLLLVSIVTKTQVCSGRLPLEAAFTTVFNKALISGVLHFYRVLN